MGTIIVGIILIAIVGAVIANMVNGKKKGISIQCGNDCKHCGGHCH